MKKTIILLLLIPGLHVWGQKDPEAEKHLDAIARVLDPGHALRIDFDYSREDQQTGSVIEGDGSLVLLEEKYKIDLGEAVIWFDGKKQYSLQTENEEVYISTPDPENNEFMFTDPIRLLSNYRESFKYRLMGETSFDGNDATEIQLYPEELGGPYALLKLYIQPAGSELKAIVIRNKEGIVYTMTVTEMKRIDDPEADFFIFSDKEYPNVDVIELLN